MVTDNKYIDGYVHGGQSIHIQNLKDFNKASRTNMIICSILVNKWNGINKYFSKAYNILPEGGLFIIKFHGLNEFEESFFRRFKGIVKPFAKFYYYFNYRGLPKMRYVNSIYNFFNNRKRKVISKIEVWGRLMYCGFEVVNEVKQDGLSYILAKKSITPSKNPTPSFHPVITLNRVSLYGKIIKIYKVRSMYPYSEFLQERVFKETNLSSTGKFTNDSRITSLGKYFRKYWIDEIPQLLNWFRGEIKLVGIRAMSQHYFSLYPQEYKDLFIQVKPGIISPIFNEETACFKEIVRIEKKYLESYLKSPLKTDFQYFWLTISHILKGVRSA